MKNFIPKYRRIKNVWLYYYWRRNGWIISSNLS
jgi:hypothetical protein